MEPKTVKGDKWCGHRFQREDTSKDIECKIPTYRGRNVTFNIFDTSTYVCMYKDNKNKPTRIPFNLTLLTSFLRINPPIGSGPFESRNT